MIMPYQFSSFQLPPNLGGSLIFLKICPFTLPFHSLQFHLIGKSPFARKDILSAGSNPP